MRNRLLATVGLIVWAAASTAVAEKKYGPGVTDVEIKLGQTMPYSGPASACATIGNAEAAYFAMINDQGGINGRKIRFISVDDGFSPPKTVEQIRKLVELEEVLLIFQSLGTATNTAIQKYLNAKRVPQLFVASGATKWSDPQNFRGPWVGSRTISPRRGSTPSNCFRTSPTRRSPCYTRTTIIARTVSRA